MPTHDDMQRALRAPRHKNEPDPIPVDSAVPCERCGGNGWISGGPTVGAWGAGVAVNLTRCSCRSALDQAERQAAEASARSARLEELRTQLGRLGSAELRSFRYAAEERPYPEAVEWYDAAGAPALYAPEAQLRSLYTAYRRAMAYVAAPAGWLWLCGPTGSGKSHLAAAIVKELAAHYAAAYASVPELLAYIARGGFDVEAAERRLDDLKEIPLLVLDDIGTEHQTGRAYERLWRLIDHRDRQDRLTIFSSNLHRDHLEPRLASRIAGQTGRGGLLVMVACDYRRVAR